MPAGVLGNTAQESWCVLPWRPVPSTTKKSPDRSRIPVDIPTGWEPRAKQSRTVALLTALCAAALFESYTVHHKKIPRPNGLGMWWTVQDSNL